VIRAAVNPMIQRGLSDCGLVCLQMLLDRPYDVIRDTALKIAPRLHESGVYVSELKRISKALGSPLTYRKLNFGPPDGEFGILRVKLLKRRGYHFVVLFNGVVINPSDGLVWDADTYLENKGQAVGLLTEDE
jgi:hypothetical protein